MEMKMNVQACPDGYAHHFSTHKTLPSGVVIVVDLIQITNNTVPTAKMQREAREQLEAHIGVEASEEYRHPPYVESQTLILDTTEKVDEYNSRRGLRDHKDGALKLGDTVHIPASVHKLRSNGDAKQR